MTMTAAELVASKKHILLDFDGPICAAFAGYGAANISRQLATLMSMDGVGVPAELFQSSDPFELLHYAASLGNHDLLQEVDAEFRRLEAQAVRVAAPTPYAAAAIRRIAERGHLITIVSNNCSSAVESYLWRNRLAELVADISARTSSDPSLLKPNPGLVLAALAKQGTAGASSVMIGDSISDIRAARNAGTSVIALANKPEKFDSLAAAKPDVLIESMNALSE